MNAVERSSILELLRTQLGSAVPFATHAGTQLVEVGDGVAVAALDQTPSSVNHLGTQHAGALFTLGETASGAAMAGVFAERLAGIRPVVSDARIAYRRPARGRITANSRTSIPPDDLRATCAREGKVDFEVVVSLMDEGAREVAEMGVTWSVRAVAAE
jgi:acyl-coenzyme A thioesterase PaaI-like protein